MDFKQKTSPVYVTIKELHYHLYKQIPEEYLEVIHRFLGMDQVPG
jgi:hypothetical protein